MPAQGKRVARKTRTARQSNSQNNGALHEIMELVLDRKEYRSSEDDDYLPRDTAENKSTVPLKPPASCPVVEEEELTLSERKKRLKQRHEAIPCSSAQRGTYNVSLPVEVVTTILRVASASNAAPILAAASCVCKAWRSAVQCNPQLWHSVDLAYTSGRVTDSLVSRLSGSGWQRVEHLSLSGCNKLTDAALKVIALKCLRLASLDLSYCTCFTEAGLVEALGSMLQREASSTGAPLQRLSLTCIQVKPRASGIDHLLKHILSLQSQHAQGPVLQELSIEGCPLLTHNGLRAVCDASVQRRRPLLGALCALRLTQAAGARSGFSIHIERLQYAAPHLQVLGLNGLCGRYGCTFNPTPGTLPAYEQAPSNLPVPPPQEGDSQHGVHAQGRGATSGGTGGAGGRGTAAAAGGPRVVAGGGTAVAAGRGEGGVSPPAATADAAVSGRGAEGGGSSGSQRGGAAVGWPLLRVCQLGTTILHSEGSLSGRSQINDSTLARLISGSSLLEELDVSGVQLVTPSGLLAALHPAAPLRRVALARSGACCDEALAALADRYGSTLEGVDVSWGGAGVSDASAVALATCPRLASLKMAGTAVTEAGVRAVVAAKGHGGELSRLQLDIGSCRGVGRGVRQAASQGMGQLRAALGL